MKERKYIKEPKTREILDMKMSLLGDRIDNVLNYIETNPTSDLNCFELNDIVFEFADVVFLGGKFEVELYGFTRDENYKELALKFYRMMDKRIP